MSRPGSPASAHRLTDPLFEPGAIEALSLSLNAVLRPTGSMAHHALVAACGEGARNANAGHVGQATAETTVRAPER